MTGNSSGSNGIDTITTPAPERPEKQHDGLGGQRSTTLAAMDIAHNDIEPQPRPPKTLSFKLAFTGLALNLAVFQMDATCLSIALPAISSELAGSSLEAFWANLAYNLCSLALHPVWATVSQAFGRKGPLYFAVALFFAGSIVFALAQDMRALIVGRILQGLGGGGIDVLVMIILADMTTLEERAKYLGLIALPAAVGNIMGPFVGALFSTYVTWRWIGWINLPLLGAGTGLLVFFLHLQSAPSPSKMLENLQHLDWLGIPLVTTGITLSCVPISWAGSLYPWSAWQTLVPLLLGIASLVAFGFYESRPAHPVLPHRLFTTKTGNMALLSGFVHGIALICLLQYLPLFYQAAQLRTAIQSAVLLLPTVIVSVVFAAGSMMLVPHCGGYVWLLRGAWGITALGTGLLAVFDVRSSEGMLLGLPILWGMGVSLLRLLLLPVQASVRKKEDEGIATANFLTIRMFGALVGLAVCSPVFSMVFARAMEGSDVALTGALAPLRDAADAINFIEQLQQLDVDVEMLDRVLRVYLASFRAVFYTICGLCGVGLVSSVFFDEIKLKRGHVEDGGDMPHRLTKAAEGGPSS